MPAANEDFKFPDEQVVNDPNESKEKLEIEVVDDTPVEDKNRAPMKDAPEDPTDEELNQYSDSAKKRIQHFTKGYHEERRAKETAVREREEALRYAQQVTEENKKLQANLGQGQTVLLEQAKKTVEVELESAKKAFREAYEKGDTDALLKAQEDLTAAKIRADRLNNFKPASRQASENTVQPSEPATTTQQPVNQKAKSWRDRNPWFGSDDEMTALALAKHRGLVQQGVDLNSDAYYEAIDKRMKEKFPEYFNGGFDSSSGSDADSSNQNGSNNQTQKTSKPATVVAPATRSTAPKKIVLTQSQVNIAKRLGVPLEAYAKQVAAQMRKQNG